MTGQPHTAAAPPPEVLGAEREQRVWFFGMLADRKHPLELRYRDEDGRWRKRFATDPGELDEIAHRLTTSGHDVYVGVLPRIAPAGELQRTYAAAQALWGDCDTARAVRKLDLFGVEPTAIVASGGVDGTTPKVHPYWLLSAPLAAGEVKRQVKRLAHHLESDQAATDPGRILRVPGSRSHKTGRVARLVHFTGEARDLDQLTGDLPDAPDWQPDDASKQAKSDSELVSLFRGRYREGERHEHFRSMAGVLLRRCDRLPPDVLLELAVSWAKDHTEPCRDRPELERNFDNLLAREKKRRGIT